VPLLQKRVVHLEKMALKATSTAELSEAFAELIQSIDAVINEYEINKQQQDMEKK
jgi:two-component system sensor histidine kinase BarA